jgi:excisionase family DNA binding protein
VPRGEAPCRLLTVKEVAGLLRLAPATVRRRIREGDLQAYRLGPGYRVSRAQLECYLAGSLLSGRAADHSEEVKQ